MLNKQINISMIPSEKLIIDYNYQRPIVLNRLNSMIKNFDINAFSTLVVSYRKNGMYAVIDGQHRLQAARKNKIDFVPCEILHDLTIEQEADMFLKINVNRGPIKSTNKFKAELATRDMDAIVLQSIVDGIGLSLYLDEGKWNKSNQIRCIALLKEIYKDDPELLRKTLDTIKKIWNGDQDSLNQIIIGAFWKFIRFYENQIDLKDLIKKMQFVSPLQIFREMKAANETIDGNKYLISAMVILKYFNKNRKNRIENIMFNESN